MDIAAWLLGMIRFRTNVLPWRGDGVGNEAPDDERIKAAFFEVAQWQPSAGDVDPVRDLLACEHCYARSGMHRQVARLVGRGGRVRG